MNSAIERLIGLHVSDVMTRDVVTISANWSMAQAAKCLAENQVSGAPVVDEQNHCVGILSTTDFVQREQLLTGRGLCLAEGDSFTLKTVEDGGSLQVEEICEDRVREHMSSAIQTIRADAPILEAARCMCQEHIHRLVVIDPTSHPIGMISTLDLVAAMVAAIEE